MGGSWPALRVRIVDAPGILRAEPLAPLAAYYRAEYRPSQQNLTGGGAGMRMPVQSERDAFRIAYGGALLIVCAVLLGALVTPVLGVALVAVAAVAAVLWEARTT